MKQTKESCKKSCTNKGFTLIELLVVVVIIAILASIALHKYNTIVKKAIASEGMNTLLLIKQQQKMWELRNQKWTTISDLEIDLPKDSMSPNCSQQKGKWCYSCYSNRACTASIKDRPDIPNFETQIQDKFKIRCRFYDGKNDSARQFCIKHLGGSYSSFMYYVIK